MVIHKRFPLLAGAAGVATLGLLGLGALALYQGFGTEAPALLDERSPPLRYEVEYPAVRYGTQAGDNRVTRLARSVAAGETELVYAAPRGYLDSLLAALEIDPASQALVFSKTSIQARHIDPERPRAIYFNDDTYVGFAHGAPTLEIATMDPELGPVFYTLSQDPATADGFERLDGRCLRCHDSYSMTGGGVPRFIVGSGYFGAEGELISHEGRIITTEATPLRFRWGGWYVSGFHGDIVHLGNIVVRDPAALADLEALRAGNLADLQGLLDTSPYPTPHSDIVAALVLQHQTDVQNALTRARFDAVTAIDGLPAAELPARLAEIAEPLVRALFMADAAELEDTIEGGAGFAAAFEARGPFDAQGRSLRDLALEGRLFRYPLSYLVYTDAFASLPEAFARVVHGRIRDVLDGEAWEDMPHLTASDRAAIRDIVRETLPAMLAVSPPASD